MLYFNLILLTACNQAEIKIKQTDKCFEQFPKDRDFEENIASNGWSKARESYMINTGDSWTYSSAVIFEKYNDVDYRLRAINSNRDSFSTERKMTKQDWEYICSSMDSLNFWCTDFNEPIYSTDGHKTNIIGKIDSHFHQIRIGNYNKYERHNGLSDSKRKLLKTSLNLLRFGGFEGLKKPNFHIDTEGVDSMQIVAFYRSPFIESFEFFINEVKIQTNRDAHYIKISSSLKLY